MKEQDALAEEEEVNLSTDKDRVLSSLHVNNNNNSELYLHDYNNTALQNRRKHHHYNNLTIRVQFQL